MRNVDHLYSLLRKELYKRIEERGGKEKRDEVVVDDAEM